VLIAVEEISRQEELSREAYNNGMTIHEVFAKYGRA